MRLPIDQPNSNTNEGAAILSTRQKTDIVCFKSWIAGPQQASMKATPRVITLLTCARRVARPKKGLICVTTLQMHRGAKVVLPENLLLDCSHIA